MSIVEKLSFCDNLKFKRYFYLSRHKTENCLSTTDFYCIHGMHRSEFFMRTYYIVKNRAYIRSMQRYLHRWKIV